MDEVIEDGGAADLAVGVQVPPAVLEDHERCGLGRVVSSGYVNPERSSCTGVELAVVPFEFDRFTRGRPQLDHRVGAVQVVNVGLINRNRLVRHDDRHARNPTKWSDRPQRNT